MFIFISCLQYDNVQNVHDIESYCNKYYSLLYSISKYQYSQFFCVLPFLGVWLFSCFFFQILSCVMPTSVKLPCLSLFYSMQISSAEQGTITFIMSITTLNLCYRSPICDCYIILIIMWLINSICPNLLSRIFFDWNNFPYLSPSYSTDEARREISNQYEFWSSYYISCIFFYFSVESLFFIFWRWCILYSNFIFSLHTRKNFLAFSMKSL